MCISSMGLKPHATLCTCMVCYVKRDVDTKTVTVFLK